MEEWTKQRTKKRKKALALARKIKIDPIPERFGIRITYHDGVSGWVVGPDGGSLLFDTQKAAEKALKKLRSIDNYSWNCTAEIARYER